MPKVVKPQGGKFVMCRNLSNCKKGTECTFAHSEEELYAWNEELQSTGVLTPQG